MTTNLKTKVYNQKGKEAGNFDLPSEIFGIPFNRDFVHQVIVSMQSNLRQGNANARTRAEVSGGGKKPWKQKGTGRARHGSTRSPIWIGGGVTHGPLSEKDYTKKINKKMKTGALYSVLSKKYKDGQILFVDSITLDDIKTKDANNIIESLSKIEGFDRIFGANKTVVNLVLPDYDKDTLLSFRNLPNVEVTNAKELNPLSASSVRYMIIVNPEKSIENLTVRKTKLKVAKK